MLRISSGYLSFLGSKFSLLGFPNGPINGGFMGFGPVDIVIIDFPGNKFNGKVAPAILDLVESGTIRLIDLLFISKDADGVVSVLAIEDLDPKEGPALIPGPAIGAGIPFGFCPLL
jgi:hypothetical protein